MKMNLNRGKWPCPVEYRDIKLIVIAKVLNKCKITMAEYMDDRQKYLELCGVIEPKTVTIDKNKYDQLEDAVDQLKAELKEAEAEGILLMEELAEQQAKYEAEKEKNRKMAEMYAEK